MTATRKPWDEVGVGSIVRHDDAKPVAIGEVMSVQHDQAGYVRFEINCTDGRWYKGATIGTNEVAVLISAPPA